jgi:hypothetical protein
LEQYVKTLENRILIKLHKADGRKVLLSFNVFGALCGVGPDYPSDITGKTHRGQLFLRLKTVFWASKWVLLRTED